MLVTIACFCLFLALLVTMVAARDAGKDVFTGASRSLYPRTVA